LNQILIFDHNIAFLTKKIVFDQIIPTILKKLEFFRNQNGQFLDQRQYCQMQPDHQQVAPQGMDG